MHTFASCSVFTGAKFFREIWPMLDERSSAEQTSLSLNRSLLSDVASSSAL